MKRRLASAALAVLLGACAAPQTTRRPAQSWSGRLGLQVLSDPPQQYHAGFELQGDPAEGELTLLSPLGHVLASLRWNPLQATLERGNERWQQPSVDQLMQQLIPAAMRVSTLFDWLQGKPAADPHWSVNLSGYAEGRIQAQRLDPLPRSELRLVLNR